MANYGSRNLLLAGAFSALAACNGAATSSSGLFNLPPSGPDAVMMGTTGSSHGSNGLAFAADGDGPSDFVDTAVAIKVAYLSRDWDTGEVQIRVLDETVTLDSNFFGIGKDGSTLNIDGDTIVLDAYSDVQGDNHYIHAENITDNGGNARQVEYSHYLLSTSKLQNYGVYIVGTETDPATVAALAGAASYDGAFSARGMATRGDGTMSEWTSVLQGTLGLDVNFDTNTISGDFAGAYQILNEAYNTGNFSGVISSAGISGNGFSTNFVVNASSPTGGTLSHSESASRLGGAFFAHDGSEIAGLLIIDETFLNGDGAAVRLGAVGTFETARD